ncbi:MAG: aminotransferase class IV, partial [Pseudomonadota bacterium]
IVGDYSNGNDGILLKGSDRVAALKGQQINLVELSVSHYLLARALEGADLKMTDVNTVNTSDADIAGAFTSDDVTAAVAWNPQLATMKANDLSDAYVRVVVWRGAGPDMGVASARNPIRMAVAAWEWGAYYGDAKTKGAKLAISKWKRPSPETIPCKAKASGLYMICTMSKHAAEAEGCSDALMMDYRGYVAEATGANIFFVKDGAVHTPTPDCFLDGFTRQTVIGLLKDEGIQVIERHIEPRELEDFEQCWLTGTAAEVTPVGQIGDYNFEVGAMAQDISRRYERLVRGNH